MKKILLSILLFLGFITQAQAQVLFWVEDALGNRDSVIYSPNSGVTPVNLYGVPPEDDLDLRIVFRADSNNCILIEGGNQKIRKEWLCGLENPFPHSGYQDYYKKVYGWLNPHKRNVDFKILNSDNIAELVKFLPMHQFPLMLHAVNYPVKLYCNMGDYMVTVSFHNRSDGKLINSETFDFYETYTFDGNVCYYGSEYEFFAGKEHYYGNTVLGFAFTVNKSTDDIIMFEFRGHVGIADYTYPKKIKIYPNPADNYILLDSVDYVDYRIFDMMGTMILEFIPDVFPYKIDISYLPDGTYFLRSDTFIEKFIINRK